MKPYKEYSETVSVKVPVSMLQKIDEKPKKRSEVMIELLKMGLQVESLIETSKNPENKLKFETDLQNLLKCESIQNTLETLDDKTLDSILFYAQTLKERRFQQEVLAVR